jgi:hypothetical protein
MMNEKWFARKRIGIIGALSHCFLGHTKEMQDKFHFGWPITQLRFEPDINLERQHYTHLFKKD